MPKERAPQDEHTGVPLLMVPHWPVKELMKRRTSAEERFFDDHHSHFKRRSKRLRGPGGLAVRHARIQRVSRAEHDRFHNECYDEPLLPLTEDDQFAEVVFCTAKYIPPVAVDMAARIPGRVNLSFRQIRRLRESGEVSVESPTKVRKFMEDFLLDRQVDGAKDQLSLIRDFLICPSDTAYDRQRQAGMARELLALVAREPVADLAQEYAYGFENGLLGPEAPPDPVEHVVGQLAIGNSYQMTPLIRRLQEKFALQYLGLPPTALAA